MTDYKLLSLYSGKIYEDSGWLLDPPGEDKPAFLRAVYRNKELHLKDDSYGFYKFADWLPVKRFLKGSAPPISYKSEGLSKCLGIKELYITFSGYWPERGAFMKTCSFKETEAYSVCARLDESNKKVLVVASAGNTARSFARVCSDNNIPLLLCMPEDNVDALWFDEPLNDNVKLIVACSGGDYFDAIHLSNLVCKIDGFITEGGAKNVARRDGMGTTTLSAVTTIGRIPDYYFQAVGSGTGAIAAWEANLRLIEDGRYGSNKMKLMVSQNIPFTPIHDAWKAHSREMLPLDDTLARKQVEEITAKVLSNRKPPYSIIGGLFDALSDTGGDVILADNKDAWEAARVFREVEGIDIHPAAAVATASLIGAVKQGIMDVKSTVMLNITGGGEDLFKSDKELYYLRPSLVFPLNPDFREVEEKIAKLF